MPCTNPGLVIAIAGKAPDHLSQTAANLLQHCSTAQTMLTPGIFKAYEDGVSALTRHACQPAGIVRRAEGNQARPICS